MPIMQLMLLVRINLGSMDIDLIADSSCHEFPRECEWPQYSYDYDWLRVFPMNLFNFSHACIGLFPISLSSEILAFHELS
jgi:hypothetical protein